MANPTSPLAELELRTALLTQLQTCAPGARIFEELHLENGAARIDVAVAGSQLAGYEIKSDFDTPARFANQIHAYNRCFDKIYLVVSAEGARRIGPLIPSWWGIYVGERVSTGGIKLALFRAPMRNPARDPISVLSMLRREELLGLAQCLSDPKRAARARRTMLYELLADAFSLDQIGRSVTKALKARQASPARVPLALGGD